MTNVAVVFQTGKGHTKVLADAVLKGVRSVTDVAGEALEISGKEVHEGRFTNASLMETLDRSDGIVFGCATYMGSASAIFKTFLEAAFLPHWLEQRWKDKIAAGFTNSASQSGDNLCTLLQLTVFAMQMGMIWVGVGLVQRGHSRLRSSASVELIESCQYVRSPVEFFRSHRDDLHNLEGGGSRLTLLTL
jgi:NAD(P)H dehydrogenase (quinone)